MRFLLIKAGRLIPPLRDRSFILISRNWQMLTILIDMAYSGVVAIKRQPPALLCIERPGYDGNHQSCGVVMVGVLVLLFNVYGTQS